MMIPTDIDQIEKYIEDQIQESLHLDYKDSRALEKRKRDEIIKDVTAFANADGGILIYGIQEEGHLPVSIDEGVQNSEINREWIDQILDSNIVPKIEGVRIHQIPLNEHRSIYVISIPKTYRGPHQAPDKKYYKRYNFRSSPMDHYEIFDIARRRSQVPRLLSVDIDVRQQMFLVSIKNISDLPIHDIKFVLPENLLWPMERDIPRALKNGIKYMPPGRKMSFFYAIGRAVFDEKRNILSEFVIHASYFHPEVGETINEDFHLNFKEFYGAAIEGDTQEDLVTATKRLSIKIEQLSRKI